MTTSAPRRYRRGFRPAYALLTSVVLLGPGLAVAAAEPQAQAPSAAVETDTWTRPVAPGVTAEEAETLGERGWQVTNAITVDTGRGASVGYISAGSLTDIAPITEQAEAAGAVAAVNGDFYDINNSGSPGGPVIAAGELLKSPSGNRTQVVAFDEQSTGRVTELDSAEPSNCPAATHPSLASTAPTFQPTASAPTPPTGAPTRAPAQCRASPTSPR